MAIVEKMGKNMAIWKNIAFDHACPILKLTPLAYFTTARGSSVALLLQQNARAIVLQQKKFSSRYYYKPNKLNAMLITIGRWLSGALQASCVEYVARGASVWFTLSRPSAGRNQRNRSKSTLSSGVL